MQTGGVQKFRGDVAVIPIRRAGFYLETGKIKMPPGMKWRYRVRTVLFEIALRFRLFFVGAWRGLVHASGVIGVGRLYLSRINAHGGVDHFGLVCTRVITNAGVTFLRDDWNNNAQDFTTFNFHGLGTGTNAENVTDTALQTECTTALNPDSTRATGTRSTPAANQFASVGTLTFDATAAVTEHGLLSQAATGGGTLWDRSVFAVVNMGIGDALQTTYTGTLSAGG